MVYDVFGGIVHRLHEKLDICNSYWSQFRIRNSRHKRIMANASNVFRVGGEYDHNTNFWGIFASNASTSLRVKIAFDGVFVLDFRKVHLLCVPQLDIKNLSLTEVRDFYARTIALFCPSTGRMNKSRTVYECCRGLHYMDPSLPENPREISSIKLLKPANYKLYERSMWNWWKTKPKPSNFPIPREPSL